MDIRIYYEDTDCGGVVYYGNYLKYFERGRTEYLETRGISIRALLDEGTQFVVIHAELTYRSPSRYGETLQIDTWISKRTKASLTMSHVIKERETGRLVVEGSATLAAVDIEGRLKRLPASLLALPLDSAATADGQGVRAAEGKDDLNG